MAFDTEKYTWEGNSKKMYEYMVGAVPFIAQLGLKKMIGEWLVKRNITTVNENLIFECEKDLAPKAYQEKFKDTLESLRTS
ncbi:MAG: hypothetical protein ACRQFF_03550 [Sphaerochaeta sp.]